MGEKPRRRRKYFALAAIMLVLYISSYVALSAFGQYRITMSGKWRPWGGLAALDVYKWAPAGIECERYRNVAGKNVFRRLNFLGALYGPLVWLDRTCVHPTKEIFDF